MEEKEITVLNLTKKYYEFLMEKDIFIHKYSSSDKQREEDLFFSFIYGLEEEIINISNKYRDVLTKEYEEYLKEMFNISDFYMKKILKMEKLTYGYSNYSSIHEIYNYKLINIVIRNTDRKVLKTLFSKNKDILEFMLLRFELRNNEDISIKEILGKEILKLENNSLSLDFKTKNPLILSSDLNASYVPYLKKVKDKDLIRLMTKKESLDYKEKEIQDRIKKNLQKKENSENIDYGIIEKGLSWEIIDNLKFYLSSKKLNKIKKELIFMEKKQKQKDKYIIFKLIYDLNISIYNVSGLKSLIYIIKLLNKNNKNTVLLKNKGHNIENITIIYKEKDQIKEIKKKIKRAKGFLNIKYILNRFVDKILYLSTIKKKFETKDIMLGNCCSIYYTESIENKKFIYKRKENVNETTSILEIVKRTSVSDYLKIEKFMEENPESVESKENYKLTEDGLDFLELIIKS